MKMNLRKLQIEDAPYMLEWMHDDTVVHDLRADFANKTEEDCIRFIAKAQNETENIHLAVADETDEYMGTVSLKHIRQNTAEFAVALRSCAMGKGCAFFAMREIMEYGYRTRGIDTVYWCVDPRNHRAIHFYEKHGFQRWDAPDRACGYKDEEKQHYYWYCVERRQ